MRNFNAGQGRVRRVRRDSIAIWGGLAASVGSYGLVVALGQPHAIAATLAVTLLCLIWWVLEPVAIPVTSLLPLACFPLLGVANSWRRF